LPPTCRALPKNAKAPPLPRKRQGFVFCEFCLAPRGGAGANDLTPVFDDDSAAVFGQPDRNAGKAFFEGEVFAEEDQPWADALGQILCGVGVNDSEVDLSIEAGRDLPREHELFVENFEIVLLLSVSSCVQTEAQEGDDYQNDHKAKISVTHFSSNLLSIL